MHKRTADELAAELRKAGIGEGDDLIVHSSLKSLGPVENGPDTVLDALLDAVGSGGNLMLPAFTYSLPMWHCDPFDIRRTPGRVGAIPEAARMRSDAARSFHPTHSVVAIGPDAEEIVANHMQATPIGLGSPFGKMLRRGAKILMLGTNQDTNSSLHLCEVAAGMAYVHVPFSPEQDYEIVWFINEKEQIEYSKIHEVPGCSRGFRSIEKALREYGVLADVQIAEAKSQLLEMRRLVPAAADLLVNNPGMLLCRIASCAICPLRREFLAEQGAA